MLAQWDRKLPSEDAQLVVTELVTNALQHAGGKIDVCLELDDESLRISVVDPEPQRLPTLGKPHGDGGYGLNIVSALSVAWGFDPPMTPRPSGPKSILGTIDLVRPVRGHAGCRRPVGRRPRAASRSSAATRRGAVRTRRRHCSGLAP